MALLEELKILVGVMKARKFNYSGHANQEGHYEQADKRPVQVIHLLGQNRT
jgi:hypothetical protein